MGDGLRRIAPAARSTQRRPPVAQLVHRPPGVAPHGGSSASAASAGAARSRGGLRRARRPPPAAARARRGAVVDDGAAREGGAGARDPPGPLVGRPRPASRGGPPDTVPRPAGRLDGRGRPDDGQRGVAARWPITDAGRGWLGHHLGGGVGEMSGGGGSLDCEGESRRHVAEVRKGVAATGLHSCHIHRLGDVMRRPAPELGCTQLAGRVWTSERRASAPPDNWGGLPARQLAAC